LITASLATPLPIFLSSNKLIYIIRKTKDIPLKIIYMKILHATPGYGSPLTEQETKNFLSESKLNAYLGTINEKQEPNVHPTWFYYDDLSNKIYVETSGRSKKSSNINNNNTIYFCIDKPNPPPFKGVKGKGSVKVHEEIDFNVFIAEKLMLKYRGDLENPMARSLIKFVKNGETVVLEINPEYYSTWYYNK
jgi:nitroimidazol reductase NimA-like FMN-containing flavoprotein (pyridoxamine 5'-phosphate oxidase superfamily)